MGKSLIFSRYQKRDREQEIARSRSPRMPLGVNDGGIRGRELMANGLVRDRGPVLFCE